MMKLLNSRNYRIATASIILYILCSMQSHELLAYRYRYAEQYYKLYRKNLYHYPEDIMTNINYLLAARSSPFVNPLNALAKIRNLKDWKYYQALFFMHINLLLVKEHMNLANCFDKYHAYFFNAPWRISNLESLQKAEDFYQKALTFWPEVLRWAKEASQKKYQWLELDQVAFWKKELDQINKQTIDYKAVIQRDLDRLTAVRKRFQAMDKKTY